MKLRVNSFSYILFKLQEIALRWWEEKSYNIEPHLLKGTLVVLQKASRHLSLNLFAIIWSAAGTQSRSPSLAVPHYELSPLGLLQ